MFRVQDADEVFQQPLRVEGRLLVEQSGRCVAPPDRGLDTGQKRCVGIHLPPIKSSVMLDEPDVCTGRLVNHFFCTEWNASLAFEMSKEVLRSRIGVEPCRRTAGGRQRPLSAPGHLRQEARPRLGIMGLVAKFLVASFHRTKDTVSLVCSAH